MGIWKSARGQGSDEMTESLCHAFSHIAKVHPEWTLNDLADGIEFATRGFLRVEINLDDVPKISEIDRKDLPTIPNRGQIASAKEKIEANYRKTVNIEKLKREGKCKN